MKWLASILVALALSAGPATAGSFRATPSADVSLPFWCDWGYDWDERCYRDFSERIAIGGDEDKVWRSALRFPLSAIPRGSIVDSATLLLSFDGVCLAPRKTERPCPARTFTIDVHPVLSRDWFREREVDFGPLAEQASLWTGAPGQLAFDMTGLVADWVTRGTPNHGLLLKLADGEEQFGVSGPKLPSSEFADAELRPLLEVTYLQPCVPARGSRMYKLVP
jgi:TGF-beta propeptide